MALLVLLPRPAGTRVVAADLGLLALDRQRLASGGAGEVHRLLLGLWRGGGALSARRGGFFALALHHDLRLPEVLDHAVLDALHHGLEDLERLLLVLDERVALAVAAEADALLEVVDVEQVVLPLLIDDL